MPKRSIGTPTSAKRSSRSGPVTRAPARLVDDDGRPRGGARVAIAGVDHAVLDDVRGRAAAVPEQLVEVRDVDDDEVLAVGRRVAHVRDPALRRVVLDVDRGQAPVAEPLAREAVELGRALEDDDVDLGLAGLVARDLDRARRPVPRLRATAAVGPAVGHDGQQVLVASLHERGRPRAVHVPEQDPHAATAPGSPHSWATARRTSSTPRSSRHGCPGTGHARARQPAHGTGTYSSAWGTPHGCQRCTGTVGAKSETTGVRTAAARWAGPVLPATR